MPSIAVMDTLFLLFDTNSLTGVLVA